METRLFIPQPAPQPANPTPGAPTAEHPVKAHLELIRANTSYGALRTLIDISTVILAVGSAIGIIIAFGVPGIGQGQMVGAVGLLAVLVVIVIAARQSALLLIDIADTLLHEHATNPAPKITTSK